MAKKDMDLYHSQLTLDDLNDLIVKYKIPRDLCPRLPLDDFVMFELSDDAIGIYHRMFDFSGVQIPFSSFLLALIKHYRVYFSQLSPLGLNKVITFKVLCWSLQIEPTVTLFRVFHTLCKQGDWFSFVKIRAPSLLNILDTMVWRHLDAAIDDQRPVAGSFNMADVCCRSTHLVKLRDMPEGVLVLFGLSRVWKSRICDPLWAFTIFSAFLSGLVLRSKRSPIWIRSVVGTPSSKIDAKAKASQKRKASTFGAASSHVSKHTRSALAQSSGSTTRPNLFVGDSDDESDDDDDACVDILLVTHLCSAVVIPPLGNQGRSFVAPAAEGSNTRVLTEEVFKDPGICKTIVDQFLTPGEMVHVESLFDDQLATKMIVLHYMMMSHGGELLSRYRELNQFHHEYVLSTDFRLKGYEDKVAGLTGLELQVSTLKKQSPTKSVDNLHSDVPRLSADLNQATILEAKKDEEILRLKTTPPYFSSFFRGQFQGLVRKFLTYNEFSIVQGKLLSLASSAGFERGLSMHQTKDEFVVVVLKKMHNEEMVNDKVDRSDPKMTDEVGSGCVSFGPNDVVISFSVGEKGDGLVPSATAGEGTAANPSGVWT
nr:hypothetical protein [Tanacetum cinerariifolium]